MFILRADHNVKLSVEETCPYPGSAQCSAVIEPEDPDDGMCLHCVKSLIRCIGTVGTRACRSFTAISKVFRRCGQREAVKLSVLETSPSQVSTQPWDLREPRLHHGFIRTIPVYPWIDTQVD